MKALHCKLWWSRGITGWLEMEVKLMLWSLKATGVYGRSSNKQLRPPGTFNHDEWCVRMREQARRERRLGNEAQVCAWEGLYYPLGLRHSEPFCASSGCSIISYRQNSIGIFALFGLNLQHKLIALSQI